ncbi:MAG: ornithine--acyl-ACP N-acyltransferase OlsB, partial [Mesorhizobium sp.]
MHTVMPECDARPNASGPLLVGRNADAVIKGASLGRIGNLEVRLARNEAEIAAAQEVRYRVF